MSSIHSGHLQFEVFTGDIAFECTDQKAARDEIEAFVEDISDELRKVMKKHGFSGSRDSVSARYGFSSYPQPSTFESRRIIKVSR